MRVSSFTLPILMVPALLLGGCSSQDTKEIPSGGIYLSTTAGASFRQSVHAPNAEEKHIASFDLGKIHRSLKDPNTIVIAAGSKGIVTSHDDGITWQVISIPTMAAVLDAIQLPSGIFIATGVTPEAQGVAARSLDGGKSWENVFTIPLPDKKPGLQIIKGPSAAPSSISVLEVDPRHPEKIWAGTNDGTILLAEQSGKTWRKITEVANTTTAITSDRQGAGIIRLIASPVNNEVTIITKDKRILTLKDSTTSEIKVPESTSVPSSYGLVLGSRKILNASLISGFPDALLLASTDGVLVTRDKGKSFLPLQLPIDASKTFNTVTVAVSPKNTNRILITIDDIIYRSEDSGATWHTTGLEASGLRITDISINPTNPARLIVVAKRIES